MGKRGLLLLLILSMVLAVPVYAGDSGAGRLLYSVNRPIASGLEAVTAVYAAEGAQPQAGHCLTLAPYSEVYPIMMACDTMYGGMTMDEAVAYAQGQGHNVVAAINTAYFTSPCIPIGLVVEEGRLRSAGDGMNAVAILEDGSYYASPGPQVRFRLTGSQWAEPMELRYLNKAMDSDDIYLYTKDFSTVSTRVTEEVWAVRLALEEPNLTLGGTVTARVTQVLEQTGALPIGEEELILTAPLDGAHGTAFTGFSVGDTLTMEIQCSDETLLQASYISGCGDILVRDGRITPATEWFPFNEGAHPRSLLGWREDGTLVLYVADGRAPGYAEGLTLSMAAEEMLRRGCVGAVNLDGGGSAIIGVRLPGQWQVTALNRPSDGGQRQSAAYLLLVTDAPSDGSPRYWHIRENGRFVLAGQRLTLHPFATDKGLYPAESTDVQPLYALDGAVLEDNVLTAPETVGRHSVKLWSEAAAGWGELRVVLPTRLRVTHADGRALGDLTVVDGQKLPLRITASYHGVPIAADETCVDYETDAPLGAADENGVFTVRALAGTEGNLTLRVGGETITLRLRVIPSPTDPMAHRMRTAVELYYGKGNN